MNANVLLVLLTRSSMHEALIQLHLHIASRDSVEGAAAILDGIKKFVTRLLEWITSRTAETIQQVILEES